MMYFFWSGGVRMVRSTNGRTRVALSQTRQVTDRAEELPAPTVTRPYYIGSAQMIGAREQERDLSVRSAKHSKRTLQEAITEAERRLATDPKLTEVSVVKIVRVVRRAKPVPPPVTVDIEVAG